MKISPPPVSVDYLASLKIYPRTVGQYTGNDSVNRAIPHGLGRVPTKIEILSGPEAFVFFIHGLGNLLVNVGQISADVTEWDEINFYVGNIGSYPLTANSGIQVYTWVAL